MIKTNKVFQLGYVVDDLDAAIERWMKVTNIGPAFIMRGSAPENIIYRGQPGEMVMDIGFCQAGDLQIELIQPLSTGPNVYRDAVPAGTQAYHHQGYFTDDMDAEFARFAALGVDVGVQGTFGDMRFAYFDTRPQIGCMTEVLERNPDVEAMFKMIADAAVDWDGSDPVRLIG